MKKWMNAVAIAVLALLPLAAEGQPVVQDVVTVGSQNTSSTTVDVPVYIRDVSGSALGIDQPAGFRIQSYSLKVNYTAPAGVVTGVTFTRAGITQSLTPTFESNPSSAGTITLIDVFQEATNLIPFVSNAPAPGNQVAHLVFNLAPGTPNGTVITLTLDPTLTQLSNEGGTTTESVTLGNLVLVNGTITYLAASTNANAVPTLGEWGLLALVAALAVAALRFRL